MARVYLIAGLVGIVLYGALAMFGAEFGSTRLNKESPAEARARRARSSSSSSGGYFGGGGFGGGK